MFLFSFHLLWSDESKEKEKDKVLIWYSYDRGLKKAEKAEKHLFLYFYTRYCKFCQKMERETFSDPAVKKILYDSFIPIRVYATSGKKVKFDGSLITEKELTQKYRVRGYPSSWFLKPDGEKIAPLIGYMPAEKFSIVLEYVKDRAYEKMKFSTYMKLKKEKDKNKN